MINVHFWLGKRCSHHCHKEEPSTGTKSDGQKCDEKQGICIISEYFPKYLLFNDTGTDSNFAVEEPECHPLHQMMKTASPERTHTSIIGLLIICTEKDTTTYVGDLAKNAQPQSNNENAFNKPQLRDVLSNCRLVLFRSSGLQRRSTATDGRGLKKHDD